MICIAAFIVLGVIVLSLPVVRIFNRQKADKIWQMFKSAWGCVGRRVTFRKCDSNFKDQIKNGILKKVVLKHPGWVKPLSVVIEIVSVLIIAVTIWSLLVGAKSLVSLAAYGTCDPVTPEACAVGDAEACYAGEAKHFSNPLEWTGNWFVEFGEAFAVIPARLADWPAEEYLPADAKFYTETEGNSVALDIFDPGCKWCRESYKNQKQSGFFDKYNVALLPYALKDDGGYRFANSDLIMRYLEAVKLTPLTSGDLPAEWRLVDRLFVENSPRQIVWQEDFNNYYDDAAAREVLNDWLKDFGYSSDDVVKITTLVDSQQVTERLSENRDIVENRLKIVKIPTMLFDNKRHDGVYKP